jgi:hypothetical protein
MMGRHDNDEYDPLAEINEHFYDCLQHIDAFYDSGDSDDEDELYADARVLMVKSKKCCKFPLIRPISLAC